MLTETTKIKTWTSRRDGPFDIKFSYLLYSSGKYYIYHNGEIIFSGLEESEEAAIRYFEDNYEKLNKDGHKLQYSVDHRLAPGEKDKPTDKVRLLKSLNRQWRCRSDGDEYTLWERISTGYYSGAKENQVGALKFNRQKMNGMDSAQQDAWHRRNNEGKTEYGLVVADDPDSYTVVNKTVYDYFVAMQADPKMRQHPPLQSATVNLPETKTPDRIQIESLKATQCLQNIWEMSGFSATNPQESAQ